MGSWYDGPTLIAALESIPPVTPAQALPLRLPVQDIYRRDTTRIIAGRIESGSLAAGDELLFSPSGQTASVSELLSWNDDTPAASAGDNVAFVLDRPLVVERGDLASHRAHAPKLTAVFDAEIFWLASKPLVAGTELTMQFALRSVNVRVAGDSPSHRPGDARAAAHGVHRRQRNRQRDHSRQRIDRRRQFRRNAGDREIRAAPRLSDRGRRRDRRDRLSRPACRAGSAARAFHDDARRFRARARQALGTRARSCGSPASRARASRRSRCCSSVASTTPATRPSSSMATMCAGASTSTLVSARRTGRRTFAASARVAALFAEAGLVCITAFISPYRDDRRRARAAVEKGHFLEVYVKADLAACEARDPKGLYLKAPPREDQGLHGHRQPVRGARCRRARGRYDA